MKLREIQKLIKSITISNTQKVILRTQEFKITVTKGRKDADLVNKDDTLVPSHFSKHKIDDVLCQIRPKSDFVLIKSPFIGTFYMNENVINPCFKKGDLIKEGDELCVIESLKLYNRIKSKMNGKIDKIFVKNSTPVEFDQPLFLINKIFNENVIFNT